MFRDNNGKAPDKHKPIRRFSQKIGGEFGIRTQGPLRDTAFRVLHHRPLGQLSIIKFYSENLLKKSIPLISPLAQTQENGENSGREETKTAPSRYTKNRRKSRFFRITLPEKNPDFECGPFNRLGTSPYSVLPFFKAAAGKTVLHRKGQASGRPWIKTGASQKHAALLKMGYTLL